jgi:hypothetical protein
MLYRTPPRILNEGGRTKGLVRLTLARRFPDLGLGLQRKVNATSFFRSVIRRETPALVEAMGDFPSLSALGIVDGRATRKFVCDALKDADAQYERIGLILTLENWVHWQLARQK